MKKLFIGIVILGLMTSNVYARDPGGHGEFRRALEECEYPIVTQSTIISDITDTEAFLIRQNGDTGDVFKVDTTNKLLVLDGIAKVTNAFDSDSDTDDVLVTTIGDTLYGLLIVSETAGTEACLFLIAGGNIEKISSDATFTVTKDNAATYNTYFESNVIKVQNKVGDNKGIYVGFYAI